jgi:hypothetical protein
MPTDRNVFISHIHEDDHRLTPLKDLLSKAGMNVRDGSIHSDKPNNAKSPDYIKSEILKPRIEWASAHYRSSYRGDSLKHPAQNQVGAYRHFAD